MYKTTLRWKRSRARAILLSLLGSPLLIAAYVIVIFSTIALTIYITVTSLIDANLWLLDNNYLPDIGLTVKNPKNIAAYWTAIELGAVIILLVAVLVLAALIDATIMQLKADIYKFDIESGKHKKRK